MTPAIFIIDFVVWQPLDFQNVFYPDMCIIATYSKLSSRLENDFAFKKVANEKYFLEQK